MKVNKSKYFILKRYYVFLGGPKSVLRHDRSEPPAVEELDNTNIIPPRASLNLARDLPSICLLANNNTELWLGGEGGSVYLVTNYLNTFHSV